MFHSNIDHLCQWIESIPAGIRPDGGMAAELAAAYSERLQERCGALVGPDGAIWSPNEPRYAARKGGLPVGTLSGEMLSAENLTLQAMADAESAVLFYPGSDFARQKLTWFQAGGRQVWGMDDIILDRFREIINKYIYRANQ